MFKHTEANADAVGVFSSPSVDIAFNSWLVDTSDNAEAVARNDDTLDTFREVACHDYKDGFLKESADRDPRLSQTICIPDKGSKHHYFLYRQTGDDLKGGAPNILGILDSDDKRPFYGNSSSGYAIAKFYSEADFLNPTLHTGDIDAPVMRFAEVLLIRAEAGAELGVLDQTELDRTVNKLRERVGFGHKLTMNPKHDPNLEEKYPNVSSDLIREIRRERRVELFCEGYRWDDICRWHVGPEVFFV